MKMKMNMTNFFNKFSLFGFIFALSFSLTAAERGLCGIVYKADVSESGDMLNFSINTEEFGIYIEDEEVKYADLVWESFKHKNNIYINLNDDRITKIQRKCENEY